MIGDWRPRCRDAESFSEACVAQVIELGAVARCAMSATAQPGLPRLGGALNPARLQVDVGRPRFKSRTAARLTPSEKGLQEQKVIDRIARWTSGSHQWRTAWLMWNSS